jgi:ribosomal protein S18 acetylase RimI-like enzyme
VIERSLKNLKPHVRIARLDDAAQIAELAAQLGHAVAADAMRSRLDTVWADEDHLLLVAESDGKQIVGWLHATVSRSLVDEPACRIAGLVVDEKSRRNEVGRALMQHAQA